MNEGWIPISKKPEDGHKCYLITRVTPKGRKYVETKWFKYDDGTKEGCWDGTKTGRIVAWMPCPKPYEE